MERKKKSEIKIPQYETPEWTNMKNKIKKLRQLLQ